MDKKAIFAVTISVLFGLRLCRHTGWIEVLSTGILLYCGFSCIRISNCLCFNDQKGSLSKLRDLPAVVVQGILGITIYHVALVYGEKTVIAGTASLIIALSPIFSSL